MASPFFLLPLVPFPVFREQPTRFPGLFRRTPTWTPQASESRRTKIPPLLPAPPTDGHRRSRPATPHPSNRIRFLLNRSRSDSSKRPGLASIRAAVWGSRSGCNRRTYSGNPPQAVAVHPAASRNQMLDATLAATRPCRRFICSLSHATPQYYPQPAPPGKATLHRSCHGQRLAFTAPDSFASRGALAPSKSIRRPRGMLSLLGYISTPTLKDLPQRWARRERTIFCFLFHLFLAYFPIKKSVAELASWFRPIVFSKFLPMCFKQTYMVGRVDFRNCLCPAFLVCRSSSS